MAIQKRLNHLPKAGDAGPPGRRRSDDAALDILIGVFFVFAAAAYWIFERDRAIDVVAASSRGTNRKTLRDTWS